MSPVSWTVTTKSGETVTINPEELMLQLLQKGMTQTPPTHEVLATVLTRYLQEQTALMDMTSVQLALVAFDLGYYYKVFLHKNEVSIDQGDSDESMVPAGS